MTSTILALTGPSHSGKSWAATYIGDRYRSTVYNNWCGHENHLEEIRCLLTAAHNRSVSMLIVVDHVDAKQAAVLQKRFPNETRVIEILCDDHRRYQRWVSDRAGEDTVTFDEFKESNRYESPERVYNRIDVASRSLGALRQEIDWLLTNMDHVTRCA